jgi:uncharacterized oxidoreductase
MLFRQTLTSVNYFSKHHPYAPDNQRVIRRTGMHLTGKQILITGGNSGIGLQLVRQLHTKQNHIIVVSRTQNHWDDLKALKPAITLLQCDLGSKEQVLQMVRLLKEKEITPDVLVNCAAIQNTPKLIENDFRFDDVEHEVLTNFVAPVWLSHLLLPGLLTRNEAAIVNISSGLAFFPKTTSAVYCATKAALHNFSQSLRYQLAETSVCVMEVILPLVDTPMTQGRGKGKLSPEYAAQKIIEGIQRSRDVIYVGKARLLTFMMSIWPSQVRRTMKRY